MSIFLHPEMRRGEVFLSNAAKKHYLLLQFSSKRLGVNSYNGLGVKLALNNWHPVFISKVELDQMNKSLSDARRDFRCIIENNSIPLI